MSPTTVHETHEAHETRAAHEHHDGSRPPASAATITLPVEGMTCAACQAYCPEGAAARARGVRTPPSIS